MKLVAVLAVLASFGVLAASAEAGTRDTEPSTSSNWSGYAVGDPDTIAGATSDQPLTYSNVTATWKQPKATCSAGTPAYSAFWVGLGGFSVGSNGLEQVGTDSDCSASGQPVYFAWYELVPDPSVRVNLKINAGDTITTAVVVNGTNVLVQIKDRTRKTSVTKTLTMADPDVSSAEWIAEAPSECDPRGNCSVLPLADFGNVVFTKIATTANTHAGTLVDPTWATAQISLVPDSRAHSFFGSPDDASSAGATPSAASPDGRMFSVGWLADATAGA